MPRFLDWSQQKINIEIAKLKGFKNVTTCYDRANVVEWEEYSNSPRPLYGCGDFCNNWKDIGPLLKTITEDLFRINEHGYSEWERVTDLCGGNMTHAAAIIWLQSFQGRDRNDSQSS